MTIHVGVDLHQRFCYMTAVNASGGKLSQARVANDGAALRVGGQRRFVHRPVDTLLLSLAAAMICCWRQTISIYG